jgi:hypothetical protein
MPNLEANITAIITDQGLTKDQRQSKLADLLGVFMADHIIHADPETIFDQWDRAMANALGLRSTKQ